TSTQIISDELSSERQEIFNRMNFHVIAVRRPSYVERRADRTLSFGTKAYIILRACNTEMSLDKEPNAYSLLHLKTMTDPRYSKLAKLLIEYSTALKRGERVLLDMIDVPDEFTIELMRLARRVGALPVVEVRHTRVTRELLRETNEEHSALVCDLEMFRMKK